MDKDDKNQLFGMFKNNNIPQIFNQSDQWFRGSGIQGDQKFSELLGKKSFNGKNSGTDLFGNSLVIKSEIGDHYSPKCIDFENSANSPFPFFKRDNNSKIIMNESQEYFGNFR